MGMSRGITGFPFTASPVSSSHPPSFSNMKILTRYLLIILFIHVNKCLCFPKTQHSTYSLTFNIQVYLNHNNRIRKIKAAIHPQNNTTVIVYTEAARFIFTAKKKRSRIQKLSRDNKKA